MNQNDQTSLIIAFLSLLTVIIAWIFRYKIAELAKGKTKAPAEVLFEGYEKLLKNYQDAILDRDTKINKLEADFDKMQEDLDNARGTIQELKSEDEKKARIIKDLELKLSEFKMQYRKENNIVHNGS